VWTHRNGQVESQEWQSKQIAQDIGEWLKNPKGDLQKTFFDDETGEYVIVSREAGAHVFSTH
jgi:hypothetical protein